MILIAARHAACSTCTPRDKQTRFSKRASDKRKTKQNCLAKSMTHHNQTKELTTWFLTINISNTSDFPIIQYADDTLSIMEAYALQLFTLKAILNTFSDSTGLKVNYSKSSIYAINILEERLSHLAVTFHCQDGSIPFTYLGLPLSMNKPIVQGCLPLVD
jgi:hypothetical protein